VNRLVLFLVGPTGSGKTELSLCLARRLGSEIVSADSMLVYKGMDIGTAKPTLAERRKVSHHLIDLVSGRSNFSVYLHRKRALQAMEKIVRGGRIPLVVGGGGLYVDAIRKGLSAIPGKGSKISAPRGRNSRGVSLSLLYERLRKMDPKRAQKIHPNDRRRIMRALEIAQLSGKRPSDWYRRRRSLEDLGYTVLVFGIERDRADLYERINRRVEAMFKKGFLPEVKRLKRRGFSKTAGQAVGYREILDYLNCRGGVTPPGEKGRGDLAPTFLISLIQQHTRQLAKRQLTWLRREKEIRWIPWRAGESAARVCDKIMKEIDPCRQIGRS